MTFDPTKPVQTRDGRPARIICTDRQGGSSCAPLAALITQPAGHEDISWHNMDGSGFSRDDSRDLINVDEFAKPGRDIVRTRDGRRAWILTRDSPWSATSPIVAIVEGHENASYYRADGSWATSIGQCSRDLILE